jgi:hypothetical protein
LGVVLLQQRLGVEADRTRKSTAPRYALGLVVVQGSGKTLASPEREARKFG